MFTRSLSLTLILVNILHHQAAMISFLLHLGQSKSVPFATSMQFFVFVEMPCSELYFVKIVKKVCLQGWAFKFSARNKTYNTFFLQNCGNLVDLACVVFKCVRLSTSSQFKKVYQFILQLQSKITTVVHSYSSNRV